MAIADLVNLSVLLIPGLWLWLTVRLAEGLPEFGSESQVRYFILRFNGVLLIVFGMVGIVASILNPFGLIVAPIALVSLLIVLIVQRRSAQERFVWALAFASDHGIEIPIVARLLASHTGMLQRKKLKALAGMLEQCGSLATSLGNVGIQLSPAVQMGIVGDRPDAQVIGSLRSAIDREEKYQQSVRNSVEGSIYLISTALFAGAAALFLHIRIFPMLIKVGQETGVETSSVARLIAWESKLGLNGLAGIMLLVVLLFLLILMVLVYLDILPKNIWPGSRIHLRFNRATVLAAIGRGLHQGQTPTAIARMMNETHPYRQYRNAANQWLLSLERGMPIEKSMHEAGFISRTECVRLRSAIHDNRFADELKWMAAQNTTLAELRWRFVSSWLLPLVLLVIGCAVFGLAWSVIELLAELIRAMDLQ